MSSPASIIRRAPTRRASHGQLLERLARRQRGPVHFAPDFLHGDFALDEIYALPGRDPDRLAFLVLDDTTLTLGLFHDHFLSAHTHEAAGGLAYVERLLERHRPQRSLVVLDLRLGPHQQAFPAAIELVIGARARLDRQQLLDLERSRHQVAREQLAHHDPTLRSHNDLLSLIALTTRCVTHPTAQAA